ncbi:MAG: adenylyl-sulfate kinase [Thermonemataceae bacterium]
MKKPLYPFFVDYAIPKNAKEALLRQKAKVIWLVGLPSAGKSTIAQGLEKKLYQEGFLTQLLDGDHLRTGLSQDLSFLAADRIENIRRVAEVAKLFLDCGVVTLASFICPTHDLQTLAKKIIGEEHLIEVFIECPLAVCEARDVKGLYAKARAGEISDFTGISSPFEPPTHPQIVIHTAEESPEQSIDRLYRLVKPLFIYS